MTNSMKMGDMFACQKCSAQIQVMKGCDCEENCAEMKCCGEDMKNITEPTVRAAGDTSVDDGFEVS